MSKILQIMPAAVDWYMVFAACEEHNIKEIIKRPIVCWDNIINDENQMVVIPMSTFPGDCYMETEMPENYIGIMAPGDDEEYSIVLAREFLEEDHDCGKHSKSVPPISEDN